MRILIGILSFVFIALGGCKTDKSGDKVRISVGSVDAVVEIAASPEQRRLGLMNRQSLEPNEGMLFVFRSPRILSFWMRETPLPLDIAFFNADGSLIGVEPMVPFDTRPVTSTALALYALEMNQGWFGANGIRLGDQLKLPREISAKRSE